MRSDSTGLNDGFFVLDAGMNSGSSPSILPKNQASFMVNVTTRGGFPRNRPKYKNIPLDFQDEEDALEWYNSHPITGRSYYRSSSGSPLLVFCCGGRFFSVEIYKGTGKVSEITPIFSDGSLDRNNQFLSKTWFCQAAQFLIAQNGSDAAFIFDGSTGRRSAINEVPTGKQMAYINGRLFVVLPDGRQIAPGDLAYVTATSVIEFTEILRPSIEGGQPLQIPIEDGAIKALKATAQLDTNAGQGTLLAVTSKSVTSFNVIIQRSRWPEITLQSIALIGNGFVSDLEIVNGDVWGRSMDGWRSYIMARREFSQWGNRPQSHEIERILELESKSLIDHETFVYFDNRLLGTCTPIAVESGGGVYHKGIIALNFENISSITSTSNPSYDGLWTGIQPYSLVTGEIEGYDRCFAFCRNQDGTNSLWEITSEYGDDDDNAPIQSIIETRSFTFDKAAIWKSIDGCELWVDNLSGEVEFNIQYRPDQHPCWFDWIEHSECATIADCSLFDESGCQIVTNYKPQYRPRLAFGQPDPACIESLQILASRGYEFQIRLQWTGNARMKTFLLYGNAQDPEPRVLCG